MAERWFVAAVQPGLSRTARDQLDRIGIESCYLQVRDSSKQLVSYFPGYLFVRLDLPVGPEPRDGRLGAVRAVNGCRGIIRMLPAHLEAPLPLPEGFVERLVEAAAAGQLDHQVEEEMQRYLAGETVRVTMGPWVGNVFKVTRYRKGALSFITSLLGTAVEVYIPQHQVEKTNARFEDAPSKVRGNQFKAAARRPGRSAVAFQI